MSAVLALISMLFLHCFADYTLQGILASMKQREWWEKQIPNLDQTQYKNDYKAALLAHAFEWAFVVMLPLMYKAYLLRNTIDATQACIAYVSFLVGNTVLHYEIDTDKANAKLLNLVQDQALHFAQIVFTWVVWFVM